MPQLCARVLPRLYIVCRTETAVFQTTGRLDFITFKNRDELKAPDKPVTAAHVDKHSVINQITSQTTLCKFVTDSFTFSDEAGNTLKEIRATWSYAWHRSKSCL